jgi:hypothetical protein
MGVRLDVELGKEVGGGMVGGGVEERASERGYIRKGRLLNSVNALRQGRDVGRRILLCQYVCGFLYKNKKRRRLHIISWARHIVFFSDKRGSSCRCGFVRSTMGKRTERGRGERGES